MDYVVKNIPDTRAFSDIASALFIKRDNDTKYHLWLPLTNIPATGSSPETIDTTVTTSRTNTSIAGRIDPGQKEITFFAHRDNFEILRKDHRKVRDFLQVNPDGTGWKFQGSVMSYQNETSVGSAVQGTATINVTSSDEQPINNVMDLIEETVTFTSAIDSVIRIEGTGTAQFSIATDPSDATATAVSDTTAVATATISGGVLTITGVASGSAVVKVTATKSGCAEGVTHILVIVV